MKIVPIGNDAQFINQQVQLGDDAVLSALEHYRNAGERLSKVRDDIKARGKKVKGIGFRTWIESNCQFTKTHAYKYIDLYENWQIVLRGGQSNLSLNQAIAQISEAKATQKQIDDEVAETVDIKAVEVVETKENEALARIKEAEKLKVDLAKFQSGLTAKERELTQREQQVNNKLLETQNAVVINEQNEKELTRIKGTVNIHEMLINDVDQFQ